MKTFRQITNNVSLLLFNVALLIMILALKDKVMILCTPKIERILFILAIMVFVIFEIGLYGVIFNNFVLSKWSKWSDVEYCNVAGDYYLVQVQYNLKTNEKRFKKRPLSFINETVSNREKMFEKLR